MKHNIYKNRLWTILDNIVHLLLLFFKLRIVSMFVNLDVRDFDLLSSLSTQFFDISWLIPTNRDEITWLAIRLRFPPPTPLRRSRSAVLCYCAPLDCCLYFCVKSSAHTSGTPLIFDRPSGETPVFLYFLFRITVSPVKHNNCLFQC